VKARTRNAFFAIVGSVLVVALGLVGWQLADGGNSSDQPRQGGTLTISTFGDPISLDPPASGDGSSMVVYQYIVEGLVDWNAEGEIIPCLATNWEFSEDHTFLRVDLREGVLFHDGTAFNADAVKANFDRILDEDQGLVGYAAFAHILDEVAAIDAHVVEFRFKQPTPGFIFDLNNSYAKIMSPTSLNRPAEDIGLLPVGTGRFKLDAWIPRQEIVLLAFEDHWAGRPYVDRLIIRPIPEPSARTAALEATDIDVAMFPPLQDLDLIQRDSRLVVLMDDGIEAYHFEINLLKERFSDLRVRRAFNHAIDKATIIRILYKGMASPLDSPISPKVSGHQVVGQYEYDPELARELLNDAQFDFENEVVIWSTSGRYLLDRELTEAVSGYLADVGMTVRTEFMDNATYFSRLRNPPSQEIPEYDLAFMNAAPGTGEANQAWRMFVATSAWPPDYVNFAYYSNDRVDALIGEALQASDPERRNEFHREIQEIVWNDAPWVFILSPKQFAYSDQRVAGTYFNILVLRVENAWLQ